MLSRIHMIEQDMAAGNGDEISRGSQEETFLTNSSGLRYRGSGISEQVDEEEEECRESASPRLTHLSKLTKDLKLLKHGSTKRRSFLRPSERKAHMAQEQKVSEGDMKDMDVYMATDDSEGDVLDGPRLPEKMDEESHFDTSDDEDDCEDAEYLLSMTSNDLFFGEEPDDNIKYIYKKAKQKRWYRNKVTYIWALITILQLLLVTAGVCHIVLNNGLNKPLQVWRICFFLAFLPYCWVLGVFLTWFLIKIVEKTMLTYPNALYFTYAIRKQAKYLLTSLSVLISWACIMLINAQDQSDTVNTVYNYILRALGCISLFLFANLLKRLIAKLMSSVFTGSNQKSRMENALKHEKLLSSLMGPRPMKHQELQEKQEALFKNDARNSLPSSANRIRKSSLKDKGTNFNHIASHKVQQKGSQELQNDEQVKIQIHNVDGGNDEEAQKSPIAKSAGVVNIMSTVPTQSVVHGAHAIGGAFAKIGSFAKKTFSDDGSEDVEGEEDQRKKRVDPLTRAQQLERLNRLEKYMRKRNLKVTFRDQLNQVSEESTVDLKTYKKLASFLFWHLTHDMDAREITRDNIAVFFNDENDINKAFEMLDHNEDGSITLKDCVASIEKIYHERCNLASSLRDTRAITNVLEFLVGMVIHTIFFFFYLLIFKAHVSEIWVGFTGLLVAFSFIFASTVSNVFENIVFLFGVHPYDIGDTLLINNQYLTVDEITINFTCCISGYNLRVWFPNQQLQSNLFVNLTTSGTKWETIYVYVDIDTDPKILDKIEQACNQVREEKKGEYGPGFRVKFAAAAMPYKVGIEMVYEYSHQGINFHRTACARSWMYETFCRILSENNVQFTWPDTKINVTDFDLGNWGQQQQTDSSRGGRSNLQTNIFEQSSNQ